jgi:sigma-E factor negative regulatory protein RseA
LVTTRQSNFMADSDFTQAPSEQALRQTISSIMDGETPGSLSAKPTAPWKDHAVARQAWHEYHVIGDVMRNEELAGSSLGDESFLLALRAKLADEPRMLSPVAAVAAAISPLASKRWLRWAAPAAVAAGFMAVASVLVVSRLANPATEGQGMALAPQVVAPSGVPAVAVSGFVGNGSDMLVRRDEALDAYLRAHRESSLGSPASWSGAPARVTSAALVQSK